MPELHPIAVVSEGGAVMRSGHGVGPDPDRIAFVFHREPNSEGAFVAVGRARGGSLPTGEMVGRILDAVDGPAVVVEQFFEDDDMVLERGESFDAITEWAPTYWGDCAEVRTDLPGANPGFEAGDQASADEE